MISAVATSTCCFDNYHRQRISNRRLSFTSAAMTMPMSQGFYASAVGSLDWLDVLYSPLQLTDKYKLPTLVRIGEGYYGNADDTCFSAMDIIKLHEVQRVDMIVAEVKIDQDQGDPDSTPPVRICLPKYFSGLFDASQADATGEKTGKLFKSVRKLAQHAPHFVRVVKKPCRKEDYIAKGDILETLGLAMCNGWWEERGFLRCRKHGEEVLLNLKWKGQYETILDPEGYLLTDILKRFKLPCTVTMRCPKSYLPHESILNNLLPHLRCPLVLEREITAEFLVGTTIGTGVRLASATDNLDGGPSRKPHQQQQSSIIVLSKNANVCFQISQDMVHRRSTYTSLLDSFGECSVDKIPLELFICEYAAPFVTFMRTDQNMTPRISRTLRPQSKSTPDLTVSGTRSNPDDRPPICANNPQISHVYADPEKDNLHRRALPPLPDNSGNTSYELDPHKTVVDTYENTEQTTVFPSVDNRNQSENNKGAEESRNVGTVVLTDFSKAFDLVDHTLLIEKLINMGVAGPGLFLKSLLINTSLCKEHLKWVEQGMTIFQPEGKGPCANQTNTMKSLLNEWTRSQSSPSNRQNRTTYHPSSVHMAPSTTHPEPPQGFTSSHSSQEGNAEEDGTEDKNKSREVTSGSPERLPNRRPPPPPPRTTPQRELPDPIYRNVECLPQSQPSDAPQLPPALEVTPPSRPTRSPPAVLPRRGLRSRVISHSFNVTDSHSCASSLEPRQHNSLCHTVHSSGRRLHKPFVDYLEPYKLRVDDSHEKPIKIFSPRSHHSTGMLLDEADLSYLTPNRELSASESNLQLSRELEPTCSINTIRDIPSDIGDLSTSELAQCFRLLKLDTQIIKRVQSSQINGSLLVKLSSPTVKSELALTDFEAEKVDAFRLGWRPDSEES